MADRLGGDRPHPGRRISRGGFVRGLITGAALTAIGPDVVEFFVPKEIKELGAPGADVPFEELPLKIVPELACVLGYSGYVETYDNKGRLKNSDRGGSGQYFSTFVGRGVDKDGKTTEGIVLSRFPQHITAARLSPTGESIMFDLTTQPGDSNFHLEQAGSMFNIHSEPTVVLGRPTLKEKRAKGIRLPSYSKAAYDGSGRVFVYTTGEVTDLGTTTLDLGSGQIKSQEIPTKKVYPAFRVYDLKKLIPSYPHAEIALSHITYPETPVNKRWAQFLSGGLTETLDGVYFQPRQYGNEIAVTADGQWVCAPVVEELYWKEKNQAKGVGIEDLLISRMMSVKRDERESFTLDDNSFIRITPLEKQDLNGQATTADVVGVTEQGQFLVAFYQKSEQRFDPKKVVLGMVNPQIGGSYEIRYISLPREVIEVNRKMAGVFPNFKPDINEFLNTPYITNEKLKELASMPAWRRYKLEKGNWDLDPAFPAQSEPERYFNVPKPTPTPSAPRLPKKPGEVEL